MHYKVTIETDPLDTVAYVGDYRNQLNAVFGAMCKAELDHWAAARLRGQLKPGTVRQYPDRPRTIKVEALPQYRGAKKIHKVRP